jgi:hypothetical protein
MAAPANFVMPYYLGRSYFPQPDRFDRRGGLYSRTTIERGIVRAINAGSFFKGKAKVKAEDIDSATSLLDEANDRFSRSLDRFVNLQKEIADASKKASADIRKATDSLAQGLARLEKVINFNQLERNVELLERAAKAIDMLAALHMSGKLEKIADALH